MSQEQSAKYSMFQKTSWLETIVWMILLIGSVVIFIVSNCSEAALVSLKVDTNPIPVVLPEGVSMDQYIYTFDLINSFHLMTDAGAQWLAWVIMLFTAVWPYVKSLMLIGCWFIPLSESMRKKVLWVLDVLGKWSFIDILFLVTLTVAFHLVGGIHMNVLNIAFVNATVVISMYNTTGVYLLMIGTALSLALAQYTMAKQFRFERQEFLEQNPDTKTVKYVKKFTGKWLVGSTFIVASLGSAVLIIYALFTPALTLTYSGALPQILGLENVTFSTMNLGKMFGESTEDGQSIGTLFIQTVFYLIVFVFPVALCTLLVPLTWIANVADAPGKVKMVLVQLIQYTFAWACIDVFVVALGMGMFYINDLISAATAKGLANIDFSVLPSIPMVDINAIIGQFMNVVEVDGHETLGGMCNLDGESTIVVNATDASVTGLPACLHIEPEFEKGYWMLLAGTIVMSIVLIATNYLLQADIDYSRKSNKYDEQGESSKDNNVALSA